MSHRFNPTSLREYDIRGIVGETLAEDDAEAVGRTFGTVLRRAGGRRVAVGRDGRESSPGFERALIRGLNASGIDVVRDRPRPDSDALLRRSRAGRGRRHHDHRQPQSGQL